MLKLEAEKKAAQAKAQKPFSGLNKILLGFFGLILLTGGLVAIPQVRDLVFNNGPLTIAEQNYVNEVNQINDLTTNRINTAYSCLLGGGFGCRIDDGYRTIYVGLGETRDRFQALKVPSPRFNAVHASLTSAYASMGSSSAYAFETINLKKTNSNIAEMLTRLDSGRKLIEQAKSDLKTLTQTYNKR